MSMAISCVIWPVTYLLYMQVHRRGVWRLSPAWLLCRQPHTPWPLPAAYSHPHLSRTTVSTRNTNRDSIAHLHC